VSALFGGYFTPRYTAEVNATDPVLDREDAPAPGTRSLACL
jgi:hypothetical protein